MFFGVGCGLARWRFSTRFFASGVGMMIVSGALQDPTRVWFAVRVPFLFLFGMFAVVVSIVLSLCLNLLNLSQAVGKRKPFKQFVFPLVFLLLGRALRRWPGRRPPHLHQGVARTYCFFLSVVFGGVKSLLVIVMFFWGVRLSFLGFPLTTFVCVCFSCVFSEKAQGKQDTTLPPYVRVFWSVFFPFQFLPHLCYRPSWPCVPFVLLCVFRGISGFLGVGVRSPFLKLFLGREAAKMFVSFLLCFFGPFCGVCGFTRFANRPAREQLTWRMNKSRTWMLLLQLPSPPPLVSVFSVGSGLLLEPLAKVLRAAAHSV